MKQNDIKNLMIFAASMSWDDLAAIILEIEEEIYILGPSLDTKELKDKAKELAIYEQAKAKLLKQHTETYVRDQPEYGTNYLTIEDYEE